MPLHDWNDPAGWEGVHLLWMTELFRHIKSQLPAGYRAHLGTAPAIAFDSASLRPDVSVKTAPASATGPAAAATMPAADESGELEPDTEVAVATIDPVPILYVEHGVRLVAAVELISPRNKDRPASRTNCVGRYVSYLLSEVNLLLVDVHPRPVAFSFADRIAAELQVAQAPLAAPMAVSYRIGGPAATGGRLLATWRRTLAPGESLPRLPLALTGLQSVNVDLEATYARAAADAYLA